MTRTSLALRIVLPALWFGMIVAISFLEAPLKFQAPGITLELGLGIGRLVFTALNIAGVIILVLLTIASLRPRITRLQGWLLGGLWLVLLVEVLLIRPPLNARTDALLAGQADPGSVLHYLYIAADVLLLVLLAAFTAVSARAVLPERRG